LTAVTVIVKDTVSGTFPDWVETARIVFAVLITVDDPWKSPAVFGTASVEVATGFIIPPVGGTVCDPGVSDPLF